MNKSATAFVVAVALTAAVLSATPANAQPVPSLYVPATPCRILDTRWDSEGNPLSPLAAGTTLNIDVRNRCNVPFEANAVAVNVHALTPGPNGALLVWPSCTVRPAAGTISHNGSTTGESGFSIVLMSYPTLECNSDIDLYVTGVTHAAIDVVGYYFPEQQIVYAPIATSNN